MLNDPLSAEDIQTNNYEAIVKGGCLQWPSTELMFLNHHSYQGGLQRNVQKLGRDVQVGRILCQCHGHKN